MHRAVVDGIGLAYEEAGSGDAGYGESDPADAPLTLAEQV